MGEAEKEALRLRLELGVNADWATATALQFGEMCEKGHLNLQTLLLFALALTAGCRSGLAPELVREIEELHTKVDAATDQLINAERN